MLNSERGGSIEKSSLRISEAQILLRTQETPAGNVSPIPDRFSLRHFHETGRSIFRRIRRSRCAVTIYSFLFLSEMTEKAMTSDMKMIIDENNNTVQQKKFLPQGL